MSYLDADSKGADVDPVSQLLQDVAFAEVEPREGFDDRIVRRVRMEQFRRGFSYWLPSLIGAAAAAACLLGFLQLAAEPPAQEYGRVPKPIRALHRQDLPKLGDYKDLAYLTR